MLILQVNDIQIIRNKKLGSIFLYSQFSHKKSKLFRQIIVCYFLIQFQFTKLIIRLRTISMIEYMLFSRIVFVTDKATWSKH